MRRGRSPFPDKGAAWNFLRVGVRVVRRGWLEIKLRTKFSAGKQFSIGRGADVRPPEFFTTGDNVSIGKNFTVETNVAIGSDVLISSNVSLVGNDHAFDDSDSTVYWQGRKPTTVLRIEGDNLLGFGTIVIGGVTIGRGCIVGAGSVVTRDLPPYMVCAGVPARVIRPRFP